MHKSNRDEDVKVLDHIIGCGVKYWLQYHSLKGLATVDDYQIDDVTYG